jgi:hypothetical protein
MAAAVALCGCGRGRANQQATNTTTATDTAATPLTIVGCLVPGTATAEAGAVGTSGNPPPPSFTLVDVTTTSTPPSGNPASGVSGTSGKPGSSEATATVDTGTPRSYSLVADKDRLEDLQRYANSRVEVTGLIVASSDTGMGVPDVGAASAPVGAPPTDVQRMRVKDVRQLESTCGAPKR